MGGIWNEIYCCSELNQQEGQITIPKSSFFLFCFQFDGQNSIICRNHWICLAAVILLILIHFYFLHFKFSTSWILFIHCNNSLIFFIILFWKISHWFFSLKLFIPCWTRTITKKTYTDIWQKPPVFSLVILL